MKMLNQKRPAGHLSNQAGKAKAEEVLEKMNFGSGEPLLGWGVVVGGWKKGGDSWASMRYLEDHPQAL